MLKKISTQNQMNSHSFKKLVITSRHPVATKHQYNIGNGQAIVLILTCVSLLPAIKALMQSNYGIMTQIMEFHRLFDKRNSTSFAEIWKSTPRKQLDGFLHWRKKSMCLFSFIPKMYAKVCKNYIL